MEMPQEASKLLDLCLLLLNYMDVFNCGGK